MINVIYNNKLDLISNTPLVYLNNISKEYNCNIYLKLEKYNLTGSSKDRAVKEMLLFALNNKIIDINSTIIEATSGNTGISLACICSLLKLKCIIVMPINSNKERIKLIKLFNASIVFTSKEGKMKESVNKAKALNKSIENSFILSQFDNYNNIIANYKIADEIIKDLPNIDAIYMVYGTGGSIAGASKRFKEINKNIKIHCVTPKYKTHRIVGIYSNIIPKNFKEAIIDKYERVEDLDSFNMVKKIAKDEGLLIGLSSGCAIEGALSSLKNNNYKNIVIYCPDSLTRYMSNELIFNEYDAFSNYKKDIDYIKNIMFSSTDFQFDDIFIKYNIKVKDIVKIKNDLLMDAKSIYDNDPAALSIKQVIDCYLTFYAIFIYRIANYLWNNKQKKLARMLSEFAHSKTNIDIHPNAKIGKCFAIDHGCGIVIGETTIIKNNVRIYQNVTLGALSLNNPLLVRNTKRHPTIGNNVTIYANATILGGKTIIHDNCIIGCNTLITKSVKGNSIIKK